MITTDIRNSTGLGCGLSGLIGSDTMAYTSSYTQFPAIFDFQRNLYDGMNRLKSAQRYYQYDIRTPDELISEVAPVKVWYSDQDPRSYEWNLDVFTVDRSSTFRVGGGL